MTQISLIYADKKRFFSVNQRNLRHLRAIPMCAHLYAVALRKLGEGVAASARLSKLSEKLPEIG